MKSRLGFSKKLLLLLMLAAAALLAGLTSVVRLSSESGNRLLMAELRQVMNSDLRSLAMQLATGNSERLDERFARAQSIAEDGSRILSNHLQHGGQLNDVGADLMAHLLRRDDLVQAAYFCDIGAGQCSEWLPEQIRAQPGNLNAHFYAVRHLLPQLRQPGDSRWSEVHRLPFAANVWGIQVLAPVFDNTTLRGFVGVSIALARLNTLLERQNSVSGAFMALVDSRQRLIAGSQTALLHWNNAPLAIDKVMSPSGNPAFLTALKESSVDAGGTYSCEIGGSSRMLARKIMPRMGWSMLVAIPAQQVTRALERMDDAAQSVQQKVEKALLLAGIGMLILAGVFCHLLLRWLMRPIRHLTQLAGDLAGGSYEQRLSLPDDKEFRPLVQAFNGMAETLQNTFRDLTGANRQQYEINQQLQQNLQESNRLNQSLQHEIVLREQAERALSQSELRLQSILSHSPEPIFVKDVLGQYLIVNPAFEELAGKPADEIIGKADLDIFSPTVATLLQRHDAQVIAERHGMEFEENFGLMNRPKIYLSSRFLMFDAMQRPYALGCIAIDITQRKQAEAELRQTKDHLDQLVEARTATLRQMNSNLALEIEERHQALEKLKESEARYQMLLDNASDGVAIIRGGELFYANPALVRLLGADKPEQVVWRPFIDFIAPDQRDAVSERYRKRVAGEPVEAVYDSRLRNISGEDVDVEISAALVSYHGVTVVIAVIRDSRARKQAERELQRVNEELLRLSTTDALTGLYNRRYLMDTMAAEFARAKRYWSSLSIMMLDVDHFKQINDRYGHQVGDQVLEHLAGLLRERTRGSDIAARYGGEELTVLLPQTGLTQARSVAETLRAIVASRPLVTAAGEQIAVTVSIGIACFPDTPVDHVERLLHYADSALYQAKESGRNRVVCANPGRDEDNQPRP